MAVRVDEVFVERLDEIDRDASVDAGVNICNG